MLPRLLEYRTQTSAADTSSTVGSAQNMPVVLLMIKGDEEERCDY